MRTQETGGFFFFFLFNRMESIKEAQTLRQNGLLFVVTFAMSDGHRVPIGIRTDGRHDNWLAALLTASPSI